MWRNSFSNHQKQRIHLQQNGKCADCDTDLKICGSVFRPSCISIIDGEIHHIIPVRDGGPHKIANWVLLCRPCHLKRHGLKDHCGGVYAK